MRCYETVTFGQIQRQWITLSLPYWRRQTLQFLLQATGYSNHSCGFGAGIFPELNKQNIWYHMLFSPSKLFSHQIRHGRQHSQMKAPMTPYETIAPYEQVQILGNESLPERAIIIFFSRIQATCIGGAFETLRRNSGYRILIQIQQSY